MLYPINRLSIVFMLLTFSLAYAQAGFDPVPISINKQDGSLQSCASDYMDCLQTACENRGGSVTMEEETTRYVFTCNFDGTSEAPAQETAFYGGQRWGDVYHCKQQFSSCAVAKPETFQKVCGSLFILGFLVLFVSSQPRRN